MAPDAEAEMKNCTHRSHSNDESLGTIYDKWEVWQKELTVEQELFEFHGTRQEDKSGVTNFGSTGALLWRTLWRAQFDTFHIAFFT